MKKLISVLLCAALALMATGAAAAGMVLYRAEEYSEGIRAAVYAQGACYVFCYGDRVTSVADSGETGELTWAEDTFLADENETLELTSAISDGEKLYAIVTKSKYDPDDEATRIKGAYLYDIEISDGIVSLGDKVKLDWDDMTESDGDDEYSHGVQSPLIQDGYLAFTAYGYNGTQLMTYEVESGDGQVFEVENLSALTEFRDGCVLSMTYEYKDNAAKARFISIDLSNGDVDEIAEFPSGNAFPSSIYYDKDTDTLYYLMSGELWAAPGFDFGKAVSICAAKEDGTLSQSVKTADGFILMSGYSGVMKYNPDPNARAAKKITVASWGNEAEKAQAEFIKAHPDTEVVMNYSYADITGAMTSQSSAIDVYQVSVPSSEYASLFARGFMTDLSGSEKLTDLTNGMYGAIKNAVIKDGKLRALPVGIYSRVYSCNLNAFKKAGLTKDDVPGTWKGFFEFLKELPETFEDNPTMSVFDPSKTAPSVRQMIATNILESYVMYLNETGNIGSFDSQLLRDLFKMFDGVDFEALRIPETLDKDSFSWSDDEVLFNDYTSISCDRWQMGGDDNLALMLLALDDGIAPLIPCNIDVMFVNPYSENVDMSIEFLQFLSDNLDPMFLADACPGNNEPIPDPYADQTLKFYEEMLKSLEESYNTAPEEEKITYEESIKNMKDELATFNESGRYRANAKSIADYRAYAELMRINSGLDVYGTAEAEITTLIRQYADRAIDGDTLIRDVDQKIRMMMLEGA